MFTNNEYILFTLVLSILIIVILSVSLITCIVCYIIPMKRKFDELSRIMFTILKKEKYQEEELIDIRKALHKSYDRIESLSTSTKTVINELNTVNNKTILPTPQLSNMIKETINEQITIETLLSNKMRLPNRKSTGYIIENTAKTYPNVDKEYIVKLCMAMIENFNMTKQENT